MYSLISTFPGKEDFNSFEEALPINHSAASPIPTTDLTACYVVLKNKIPIGRFAFYENTELIYQEQKAATIGQYACEDSEETALYLLESASKLAKKKGYDWLIGPMDGSTWNNYRFNTQKIDRPFLMEIDCPLYYNEQFTKSGFEVIAHFNSQITEDLIQDEQMLLNKKKGYEAAGANFRKIDLDNYEKELNKIADFCNEAFQANFLFTPIKSNDFVKKYLPLKAIIDPTYVELIEGPNAELWAICFCFKDLMDPKGETLIIKTLARKKSAPIKDIAFFMGISMGNEAAKNGYKQVIHALMRSDNSSVNSSTRSNAQILSRYALYGKKL